LRYLDNKDVIKYQDLLVVVHFIHVIEPAFVLHLWAPTCVQHWETTNGKLLEMCMPNRAFWSDNWSTRWAPLALLNTVAESLLIDFLTSHIGAI